MPVEIVFVNGTVGVGKTTVAEEISRQEEHSGGTHAAIDLDAIRRLVPSPADDPFALDVELTNLRDLARNYRAAGATRLVLSGVLEDAAAVSRYRDALDRRELLVVRLRARPEVVTLRVATRDRDDADRLAWDLRRAPELAAIQEGAGIDDLVVDASDERLEVLARRIRFAAGWEDQPAVASAIRS